MNRLEQSEQLADRARQDLQLTLEELERRFRRASSLRYQWRAHRETLLGAAVVAAVVFGAVAVIRKRRRPALQRRRRARMRAGRRLAMQRAWAHPERIATRRTVRPFPVELGQRVALILVSAFANRLARRLAKGLLPSPAGLRLSEVTH